MENTIKLATAFGPIETVTPYGSYMAAETVNNNNFVVYSNSPPFPYISVLKFDQDWVYIDTASHEDASLPYYVAESDFEVDFNNDGIIGSPESHDTPFMLLEYIGNTKLLEDEDGFAWVEVSSVMAPLTTQDGTPLVRFDGYGYISAAETLDEINYIVYSNEVGYEYQIDVFQCNNNWEIVDQSSALPNDGSNAYYSAEVDFGVDFNSDGTIGEPSQPDDETVSLTPVETIGNAYLLQDESGNAWVSSDVYEGYLTAGGGYLEINDGYFLISAVEVIDGKNYFVVDEGANNNHEILILQPDDTWDYTWAEYQPSIPDDGNFAYYKAELDFGFDFNRDGAIGLPIKTIEQQGDVHVSTEYDGLIYIENGPDLYRLKYFDNFQYNRPNYDWQILAAERWNGSNFIVESNRHVDGIYVRKVDQYWNNTNYLEECIPIESHRISYAEAVFQIDFNGDEIIDSLESFTCPSCITFSTKYFCSASYRSTRMTPNKLNDDWKTYDPLADINMIY